MLLQVSASLVPWGGMRLVPLGMSATLWPTIAAPNDGWWWWVWSSWWNDWIGRIKPKYSEKTCRCAASNLSWPDSGFNPGRDCGKLSSNHWSYGMPRFLPISMQQSLRHWEALTYSLMLYFSSCYINCTVDVFTYYIYCLVNATLHILLVKHNLRHMKPSYGIYGLLNCYAAL
jgi:hypothetical protein